MFFSNVEGASDPYRIPRLAIFHEGSHVDRGTDIWVNGTSEEFKGIAIYWFKFDFSGFLVEGLVDTRVEYNVVQSYLTRHAAGHLTFALQ